MIYYKMGNMMTRDEIESKILEILKDEYEIENLGKDDNLAELHDFDSLDGIDMLGSIEDIFAVQRLDPEKEREAMQELLKGVTLNKLVDYVEMLFKTKR